MTVLLSTLPRHRLMLVWILVALGLAAAIFDYAAEMKIGFSFDMRCDLRDFPNYYFAAQARAAGLSPYDIPSIQQRFDSFVLFVYPSVLLTFFAPLARLDMDLAGTIFTMIKVAVLGLMVMGWVRAFRPVRDDLLFAAFICIGLNITLFHDICGGNVAVFEAAALAWAFYFLLRQRLAWFFVLVALAGMWKIIPLALALLAIVVYPRERLAWIGTAVLGAAAVALLILWWLIEPQDVTTWLLHGRFTFVIRMNYFEAFKELFWINIRQASLEPWFERPEIYAFALFFLGVTGASAVAWKRSLRLADTESVRLWRLLLGGTAFVIVMPGAFIYSYVFALPLVYLPLRQGLALSRPVWLLALLGFAIALMPTIPWRYLSGEGLALYQPLFAATVAWLLLFILSPEMPLSSKIPAQSARTVA